VLNSETTSLILLWLRVGIFLRVRSFSLICYDTLKTATKCEINRERNNYIKEVAVSTRINGLLYVPVAMSEMARDEGQYPSHCGGGGDRRGRGHESGKIAVGRNNRFQIVRSAVVAEVSYVDSAEEKLPSSYGVDFSWVQRQRRGG